MSWYEGIADCDREMDCLRHFFKETAELAYDDWDWDGEVLEVWYKEKMIERYTREDLIEGGVFDISMR